MPTNMPQLRDANASRHRDGAARQVAAARAALPKLSAAPTDDRQGRTLSTLELYVAAVQLRIRYPRATVGQLAAKVGMSKGRYWSTLRRALRMAEGLPDPDGKMVLF